MNGGHLWFLKTHWPKKTTVFFFHLVKRSQKNKPVAPRVPNQGAMAHHLFRVQYLERSGSAMRPGWVEGH